MKVTYEEVRTSFSKIVDKKSILQEVYVDGDPFPVVSDEMIDILNFIEQHKPPTREEVVNAWDMCGYKLDKKTDNNLMFRLGGSRLYSFDIYTNGKVKIRDTINYIRSDELNAINLTIRYMESQQ